MKKEFEKIVKFIVCGGSATLIDFLIYFIISDRLNISVAKTISMSLSCTYSYFVNKAWTFQIKEKTNKKYVFRYIFSQLINIFVNVMSNDLIYSLTKMKLVAYVFATGIAMVCNYMIQRFFVFSKGER